MGDGCRTIGSYFRIYEEEPSEVGDGTATWYYRSANMVCAYSSVEKGSRLILRDSPEEYFVWAFFTPCRVSTPGEEKDVKAGSLVIVPPGDSTIEFADAGSIWRGFTASAADLLGKCANNAEYPCHPEGVAPLDPWPMPVDGYRLRVYDLDDCAPAGAPRCFRHRTGMTNFAWPIPRVPRPTNALSPHTHVDFEQASLIYAGTMVHHMRRAWSRDMTTWMPDEHVVLSAPAIAISKPPDVHTTQAVSTGGPVGLIDVFAPPRWDFSNVDGMVRNAEEYPLPAEAPASYGIVQTSYAANDPRSALERKPQRA